MRIITMKELIEQALEQALLQVEKCVPKIKKLTKSICIDEVLPIDLPAFMTANSIPNTAYFSGRDNGSDGWDEILLSWDIVVPTTADEKLVYKTRAFSSTAYRKVHELLTVNGYKRVGYNTALLKEFKDTTVYDMYIASDFDKLVKYYQLSFILS